MYSCPGCWWEGTGTELDEWDRVAPTGDEGKCPRCGAGLDTEGSTSGLTTIGEVARAAADMPELAELAATTAALDGSADYSNIDPRDWRRVDGLFGRMPDPVEVWRAVGLREGGELDEDKLGLYWAWASGAAKAHDAPTDTDSVAVAHGKVAKDDVDWPATFALNILLPDEKEIRLTPGAGIELLDIGGSKIDRRVTAAMLVRPAIAPSCRFPKPESGWPPRHLEPRPPTAPTPWVPASSRHPVMWAVMAAWRDGAPPSWSRLIVWMLLIPAEMAATFVVRPVALGVVALLKPMPPVTKRLPSFATPVPLAPGRRPASRSSRRSTGQRTQVRKPPA